MPWDSVQQYIRIIAYGFSGFLAGYGFMSEGQSEMLGGAIVAASALAWTIYWNSTRKDA